MINKNVTSTADSQSVVSHSTFCNQHISAKSVDGEDTPDVRRQQLIQGMECGQLSVDSNSNGFHEEMGSQKMSDHLLKWKKIVILGRGCDLFLACESSAEVFCRPFSLRFRYVRSSLVMIIVWSRYLPNPTRNLTADPEKNYLFFLYSKVSFVCFGNTTLYGENRTSSSFYRATQQVHTLALEKYSLYNGRKESKKEVLK